MKWIKDGFDFYLTSSIHVALAICALTAITFLNYNLSWDAWFFIFIFSASITGYNFVKYAGSAKFHHRSLTNQLKSIQIFSSICFILLLVSVFKQHFSVLIYSGVLGLFTLFYAVPFLPHHKNLRRIKVVKTIVISVVWALTTTGLPLAGVMEFDANLALRILICFFFISAIIIPFEIRDLTFDAPDLGTLPQLIGVKKTKMLGYLMLLIFVFLSFRLPLIPSSLFVDCFVALLAGLLIRFSSKEQSSYYASFWVESLPIIWFLLRLIVNHSS